MVFGLVVLLLAASDSHAQEEGQQAASLSTCRTICAKSSGLLDDSEKALLRQCVTIATCTVFSGPPQGKFDENQVRGGFNSIVRDPAQVFRNIFGGF